MRELQRRGEHGITRLPRGPMILEGLSLQDREVGAIKIGGLSDQVKKARGTGREWRPPVKYDHFVVMTKERDSAGRLKPDKVVMDALTKEQGEKPKRIGIYYLDDDPSVNFSSWYAFYDSRRARCIGNGQTARRLKKDGAWETIQCVARRDDPGRCGFLDGKSCKPHGKMQCLLQCVPLVGAVYTYRTCGWNSVNAIYTSQMRILGLTGALAALPLELVVGPMSKPVETSEKGADGKPKIIQSTFFVVHVEYRGEVAKLLELAAERRQVQAEHWQKMKEFAEWVPTPLLDAPGAESEKDAKEIAQEFHEGGVPENDVDKEFERRPATVVDMTPAEQAERRGSERQERSAERAEPEHSGALDGRSLLPSEEKPSPAGKSIIDEARERSEKKKAEAAGKGRGTRKPREKARPTEESPPAEESKPQEKAPAAPAGDGLRPPDQTDLF